MSPKRRRARPARTGERTATALMPAVCHPNDVERLMTETHDTLIAVAGAKRRSGVGWRIYRHADNPRHVFGELFSDGDPAAVADFQRVFDELGDDAVLVVANCRVAR